MFIFCVVINMFCLAVVQLWFGFACCHCLFFAGDLFMCISLKGKSVSFISCSTDADWVRVEL